MTEVYPYIVSVQYYLKEKSSSSIYEFLIIKEYPLLNAATIRNIKRFIPNLTEDEFKKTYSLTEREITIGKGKDFNAILNNKCILFHHIS